MYYILFDTDDSTYFISNFTPSSQVLRWSKYKELSKERIGYRSKHYSGDVNDWLSSPSLYNYCIVIPVGPNFPELSSIPSPAELQARYPEYFI